METQDQRDPRLARSLPEGLEALIELALGRQNPHASDDPFNMAILALRGMWQQ